MRFLFILIFCISIPAQSKLNQIGSLGHGYVFDLSHPSVISDSLISQINIASNDIYGINDFSYHSLNLYIEHYQSGLRFNSFNFKDYRETEFEIYTFIVTSNFRFGFHTRFVSIDIEDVYNKSQKESMIELSYSLDNIVLNFDYEFNTNSKYKKWSTRLINRYEIFAYQIIYEEDIIDHGISFLGELNFNTMDIGLSWNSHNDDIGAQLGFRYASFYSKLQYKFHALLGSSKSLNIAFFL